jgi:hypothetical protein
MKTEEKDLILTNNNKLVIEIYKENICIILLKVAVKYFTEHHILEGTIFLFTKE